MKFHSAQLIIATMAVIGGSTTTLAFAPSYVSPSAAGVGAPKSSSLIENDYQQQNTYQHYPSQLQFSPNEDDNQNHQFQTRDKEGWAINVATAPNQRGRRNNRRKSNGYYYPSEYYENYRNPLDNISLSTEWVGEMVLDMEKKLSNWFHNVITTPLKTESLKRSQAHVDLLIKEADRVISSADAILAFVNENNIDSLVYADDIDDNVVVNNNNNKRIKEEGKVHSSKGGIFGLLNNQAEPITTATATVTSDIDWSEWTVRQLKNELKQRGLESAGKKMDLISRLEMHEQELKIAAVMNHVKSAPVTAAAAAVVEEKELMEEPRKEEDWLAMTVTQLRTELKHRGLSTLGKKADLVSRLCETTTLNEQQQQPQEKENLSQSLLETSAGAVKTSSTDVLETVADEPVMVTAVSAETKDWSVMTVAQLKKELKDLGLSFAGKKSDLVSRLCEAHAAADNDAKQEAISSPPSEPTVTMDFSSFTVAQLRNKLKELGLQASGKKQDLVERLQSA